MKLLWLLAVIPLLHGCVSVADLPAGLNVASPLRGTDDIRFLFDNTFVDQQGKRVTRQQIFDEVFAMVDQAEKFILLDMFLFNSFQGPQPETTRALAGELTRHLVNKRVAQPNVSIVVLTDPVNTVYDGIPSIHLDALRDAGVTVIVTNLDPLRDSNPGYSLPYRIFIKPFGNGPGKLMPNPFGEGRVSLRSWFRMLNFKANHRKVIVVDEDDTITGLITSANPHDGSSAHRNTAVRFSGMAAADLLATEAAVAALGGELLPDFGIPETALTEGTRYQLQILTEGRIKDKALGMLAQAQSGWEVQLVMFYLSDRDIVNALKQAHSRGVRLQVLLDPNKDAFGWRKNGIPNRPVARELYETGIAVRWCDTHGEQCHAKTLFVLSPEGEAAVLTGSANYTRRNLGNFNLETNVYVKGRVEQPAFVSLKNHLDHIWLNEPGEKYSVDYSAYGEKSFFKRLLYRFQEATGMSTF